MAGWKCLAVVLMFTYISASPLDADSKDIRTPVDPASDKVKTINLKMKGAHPTEDDAYLCSSYSMENLPEDVNYIVQFEAKADVKIAHHILLFGCDGDPARSHDIWKCPAVCSHDAQEQILFAWAKAAPPTKLPPDVGYRVGRKSTIKNIVLQVHYKHKFNESAGKDYSGIKVYVTPEKQKYVAGIYLLLSMYVNIPPNTPVTHADISCEFDMEKPIHPFAYRTHAHSLGKVISGYVYNESWYEIGKGNPQWPQAFYPTKGNYVVKPGDKMVARCTYDSIGRNRVTHIGATGRDEMCNFYIMFYTDSDVKTPYHQCNGDSLRSLVEDIPADSDKPLPPNPALEEEAKGHHHSPHPSQSSEPSGKDLNMPFFGEQRYPDQEDYPDYSLYSEYLKSLGPLRNQKRYGQDYYEDLGGGSDPEMGLYQQGIARKNRNRNKAFEEMNRQLNMFPGLKQPSIKDDSGSRGYAVKPTERPQGQGEGTPDKKKIDKQKEHSCKRSCCGML